MFHITYFKRTVNILKCAKCKAYDLSISPSERHLGHDKWAAYAYVCEKCGANGSFRLSTEVHFESFATWDELQDRIDELKAAMSLTGIK